MEILWKMCDFDTYRMHLKCYMNVLYSPLDMNVRSKFKLSHAASNLVMYSLFGSDCGYFIAEKSGMVRVAKTSLFLYKSKVTPLALTVGTKIHSHKVNKTKIYCENCIIAVIMSLDGCTFLFIMNVFFVDFESQNGVLDRNSHNSIWFVWRWIQVCSFNVRTKGKRFDEWTPVNEPNKWKETDFISRYNRSICLTRAIWNAVWLLLGHSCLLCAWCERVFRCCMCCAQSWNETK